MSPLAARVRTGATLIGVAALLLWLHRFFPAGALSLPVVALIAGFAVWELDRMGSLEGRRLGSMLHLASLVMAAFLLLPLLRTGRTWPASAAGSLLVLYGIAVLCSLPSGLVGSLGRIEAGRERLPIVRQVLPAALWLLPPLYSVVLIDRELGIRGLVAMIVLAKIGDNAGYFVGRSIGRRRPFPQLSPGKTVAGCVASLGAGVLCGALLLPFTLGGEGAGGVALAALVGGLINVAAQAGDLSESWVKRRVGVKDSSGLLGASGGVLDVIDSLLLASPVALLLLSWAYGRSEPLP